MSKKRILTDEEKEKIQESKKELNEYRDDIKYIADKLDDAEDIKTKMKKVTTILSSTKTNSSNENNDKIGDALIKLEELEIDCTERMKEALLKKFKIDDKIEKVEQPYKNILFYRYTKRMDWREVAKELGYALDYVYELHGEALYLYSKI